MIGQKELLSRLEYLVDSNKFPRFSIIIGDRGSGKKLLSRYIASKVATCVVMVNDISVGSIRDMIHTANKVVVPTVFVIPDADTMSVQAKNTLLKITEEPPYNTYFILTLLNEKNTLPTITSRASKFYMDKYTPTEINEYYTNKYGVADEITAELIADICVVPEDVDILKSYGVEKFNSFVNSVVDNIATVSGANALKIGKSINFKDDDTKMDLVLFWQAFMNVCMKKLFVSEEEVDTKYGQAILITHNYLNNLRITGLNKETNFDMWVLDIRKAWL